MNLQTTLFRMGIGTWIEDIPTLLPTPAAVTVPIGQTMPSNVGFIYGISTYADGVDSENQTLISTVQSQLIFMTLQDGPTQFIQKVRLSDLLNEVAGSPVVRAEKFTPVAIPAFDLSKSFYQNPTSVAGAVIRLKLWYIQKDTWNKLKEHFTFDQSRPKK